MPPCSASDSSGTTEQRRPRGHIKSMQPLMIVRGGVSGDGDDVESTVGAPLRSITGVKLCRSAGSAGNA